jgi:hypothetical protein
MAAKRRQGEVNRPFLPVPEEVTTILSFYETTGNVYTLQDQTPTGAVGQ